MMLHKFFEPGDGFAPTKLGYGAGWPIAWQGWALLAGYFAAMLAFGLLLETGQLPLQAVGGTGMAISTLLVVFIAKARTRGGWKRRG